MPLFNPPLEVLDEGTSQGWPTRQNFVGAGVTATVAGDTATITIAGGLSSPVGIADGGTGQTTATAAFDALAPTTTAGDTIYHNGTDNVRLPIGTAGQVLTVNAGATAPEWQTFGGSFMFTGVLAADVSTSVPHTSPVDVTGLVFTYEANSVYFIEVVGAVDQTAGTTGFGLQFNLSSAVTSIWHMFVNQATAAGTITGGHSIADDASADVSTSVAGTNDTPFMSSGILVTTGNTGTAQLRLRSEVTVVSMIRAGTVMRVHKVA